jgi:hypothetical protein
MNLGWPGLARSVRRPGIVSFREPILRADLNYQTQPPSRVADAWLIINFMLSWDALDPFRFAPAGKLTSAFLGIAKADLRSAAQYVAQLPYRRNSDPEDPLIVLVEKRGTCSTKHALLRRVAIEQGLPITLILGIYEMTERNTPGIAPVLRRHGLKSLLEAHCYLRTGGKRIDVTREPFRRPVEPIKFLHEEEIAPNQITRYKVGLHQKFLKEWMTGNERLSGLSFERVWSIREDCIASLSA